MNAEMAVLDILATDATVSGLVSTRLYMNQAHQSDSMPYVIIELSDNETFPSKSGVGTTDHSIINVFSYASTYKEAKNLGNACRLALDGQSGTFNSVEVEDVIYRSESSFDEEINNKKVFAKDQEYLVRIKF